MRLMAPTFAGAVPQIYATATDSDASPDEIATAARALTRLAERAHEGSTEAVAAYQATAYGIHEARDPTTQATRDYLLERGHRVEDRLIARVEHPQALDPDQMRARALELGGPAQRSAHPMSVHLFDGEPTQMDLAIYMRHHWHRTKGFYKLFADFGRRLPLSDVAPIYSNLYDETGCTYPDAVPHPLMLQRLLQYLGVPCDQDDHSWLTAGQAYLNNRVRCMRSSQVEWGWGMLFSLECIVHGVHTKILHLLRRMRIPEEQCEFHRLHSELDAHHAAELLDFIVSRIRTASEQQIFFSSIAHHQSLGRRYFDAIWAEMQQHHRDAATRITGS